MAMYNGPQLNLIHIGLLGRIMTRRRPLEDREREMFMRLHGGMTNEEWEAKKAEYQAEYDAQCRKDKAADARRIVRERKRKAEIQARRPEWAKGDGWTYDERGSSWNMQSADHESGLSIVVRRDGVFLCTEAIGYDDPTGQEFKYATPEKARQVADAILDGLL